MYFLTVWLKKDDTPDMIESFSSIANEYVKNFCKTEEIDKKVSPSGKRITITLPCDSPNFNCSQGKNTIQKLILALESRINRIAKAKSLCNLNEKIKKDEKELSLTDF